MASGSAAPNYHGQITAGQVDTVTLPAGTDALPTVEQIEIVNVDGTARIDYTLDGTTPVAGGSPTGRVLPASICSDSVNVNEGTVTIKLTSAGTPHYSILAAH